MRKLKHYGKTFNVISIHAGEKDKWEVTFSKHDIGIYSCNLAFNEDGKKINISQSQGRTAADALFDVMVDMFGEVIEK